MRILMISSDPTALKPKSRVEGRWIDYADLTDGMTVLVVRRFWWPRAKDRVVSPKLTIIFCGMWRALLFKVRGDYDLVSAQTPFHDGLFGYMQAILHKIPLQIQVHTDIGNPAFKNSHFRNRLYLVIAGYLLKRASHIRVVSQRIKDALQATAYSLQASKIDVLPVFIDTEHFKNAPITVDLHKKYPQFDKIVLMLSRLAKEKNIPLGMDAFQELLKKYPNAGLVIVGSGPERSRLENLSSVFGLRSSVVFESWCDDPASYYKTADCFLNTSDYEGYGMTIVEALASGCPVVSTDVGIAREAGASIGETKEDLAKCLTLALTTPRPSAKLFMSKDCYLSALKNSWERVASGT